MKFKGTKGNWSLKGNFKNAEVYSSSYGSICAIARHSSIDSEVDSEASANALLISKAPEMLEKLIKISEFLKWQSAIDRTDGCKNAYTDIENLIKEVTEL